MCITKFDFRKQNWSNSCSSLIYVQKVNTIIVRAIINQFQAIILKESLSSSNIHGVETIVNELTDVISNAHQHHKKSIKAQKVRYFNN